jgi:hypothetical protein
MDQTYSGAWDFRDTRASRRETVERLDRLSKFLDTALVIPGTGVRFGADAVIGLVPGVGDAITTAMSCWIIYEAHRLGVPRWLIWRMAGNVALDSIVGAVPIVGDLFDVVWRSNRRNMRLLRSHLEKRGLI